MSESNPAFRPTHSPTGTPTEEPTARSLTGFTNPDADPQPTGESSNSEKQASIEQWAGITVLAVVALLVAVVVVKRGRRRNSPVRVRKDKCAHHGSVHEDSKELSCAKRQRTNVLSPEMSPVLGSGASSPDWSASSAASESPPSSAFGDDTYMLFDDQPADLAVRLDIADLSSGDAIGSLDQLKPPAIEEVVGPVRLAVATDFYPLYLRNERSHLRCFPACLEFNEAPSLDENEPIRLHQVLKRGTCGDAVRVRVTALTTHAAASDLVLLGRISSSKLDTELVVGDGGWSSHRIAELEKNSHYVRGVVIADDLANAEVMGDECTFTVSFKPKGQWSFKGRLSKKHPLYFEVFVLGPASFASHAARFDSLLDEQPHHHPSPQPIPFEYDGGQVDDVFVDGLALGDLFADGLGDLTFPGGFHDEIVVLDGAPTADNTSIQLGSTCDNSLLSARNGEGGRSIGCQFGSGLLPGEWGGSGVNAAASGALVVLGCTRSRSFQCATTKSRREPQRARGGGGPHDK
jgi:hypothetical protein